MRKLDALFSETSAKAQQQAATMVTRQQLESLQAELKQVNANWITIGYKTCETGYYDALNALIISAIHHSDGPTFKALVEHFRQLGDVQRLQAERKAKSETRSTWKDRPVYAVPQKDASTGSGPASLHNISTAINESVTTSGSETVESVAEV